MDLYVSFRKIQWTFTLNVENVLLKCPNKLAPAILDEIKKDENNAHDESLVRNTRSFRKKKNEARSKVRESNKSSSGDYKPKWNHIKMIK